MNWLPELRAMTDELLAWQTRELLARETHREGHVVYVRPELVVEIAFNEVQRSTQYPGPLPLSSTPWAPLLRGSLSRHPSA